MKLAVPSGLNQRRIGVIFKELWDEREELEEVEEVELVEEADERRSRGAGVGVRFRIESERLREPEG